jgi:hypothetical protein
MSSNRINDNLLRDLFVFDDVRNLQTSQANKVWPSTIIDQVFDQLSPTMKTLREILADLKHEILTGGLGNIQYPVTSVNGYTGDIKITAEDLGLGRVNNTRDIDKPLSTPQKNAIMEILKEYNFKIDLDELYNHLINKNNPHSVTIDDINSNDGVTNLINQLISRHSASPERFVHFDIRRKIDSLWVIVDDNYRDLDHKILQNFDTINKHIVDPLAHDELFMEKESLKNKSTLFNDSIDNNHLKYPSTKAVIDFVSKSLNKFKDLYPPMLEWIANIKVILTADELPTADVNSFQNVYIIKYGFKDLSNNALTSSSNKPSTDICNISINSSGLMDIQVGGDCDISMDPQETLNIAHCEDYDMSINSSGLMSIDNNISTDNSNNSPTDTKGTCQVSIAICRKDPITKEYYWDIEEIGAVSYFDKKYFIETSNGLSLDVQAIFSSEFNITNFFDDVYSGNHPEAEAFFNSFIRGIKILPGTMDGYIRYYINNDETTMRETRVAGLKRLAFKEWVTEHELRENAIFNRHLVSRSVDSRVLADGVIHMNHLDLELAQGLNPKCTQYHLLGNIHNTNGLVHEVDLVQLGDLLRPIIGGWPDPTVPGSINNQRLNQIAPFKWEPGIVQQFFDGTRGMRFFGRISVTRNENISIPLNPAPVENPINSRFFRLIEAGGSWCTDSERKAWSTLGGSNLTGHTFGDIELNKEGILFQSISIGDRIDAPYDLWIRYLPMSNDPWITDEWYDDPNKYLIPEPTPIGSINYFTETIVNLISGAMYEFDGVQYAAESSSFIIKPEWFGKIIEIIKIGNRTSTRNSIGQYLLIPIRDPAPQGISTTDSFDDKMNGTIVGVTNNMEFKQVNSPTWIDAAIAKPINLAHGSYQVRNKASAFVFASQHITVNIN